MVTCKNNSAGPEIIQLVTESFMIQLAPKGKIIQLVPQKRGFCLKL